MHGNLSMPTQFILFYTWGMALICGYITGIHDKELLHHASSKICWNPSEFYNYVVYVLFTNNFLIIYAVDNSQITLAIYTVTKYLENYQKDGYLTKPLPSLRMYLKPLV